MNPVDMIKNFMGKGMNPEQILANMLNNNNNPVFNNLLKMAKEGNSDGVRNFARNLFKEQGRDFDKEFTEFRQKFN